MPRGSFDLDFVLAFKDRIGKIFYHPYHLRLICLEALPFVRSSIEFRVVPCYRGNCSQVREKVNSSRCSRIVGLQRHIDDFCVKKENQLF